MKIKTTSIAIIGLLLSLPSNSMSSPGHSYSKVYKECMEMPDFKEDDDALNSAYKKLMKLLPPEKAAKLKAEQKEWVKGCKWTVENDGRPHKNLQSATVGRREQLEEMLSKLTKKKEK
jgi:uncharacterized protein YecT (DUF1311 family)